jgi:hypothetical protein
MRMTRVLAALVLVPLSGCWIARASVSSGSVPVQGDLVSGAPSLSQTGRFVSFSSDATNLVRGDVNGVADVFVRDVRLRTTELVSIASDGTRANGASRNSSISEDGRFVAFETEAANLFTADTDGKTDIVVRDRKLGTTTVVSVDDAENPITDATVQPVISGNGNVVAFVQLASMDTFCCAPLGPFVRDRANGTTRKMAAQGFFLEGQATLSENGRRIAYGDVVPSPDPTAESGSFKALVADTTTGTIIRVVDTGGVTLTRHFDLALSGDGDTVAYLLVVDSVGTLSVTDADIPAGPLHPVQTGLASPTRIAVSDDASNIAVRVLDGGSRYVTVNPLHVVSRSANGTDASSVDGTDLSGDGKFVAFATPDPNMVGGDTNGVGDVFVRSVADTIDPPA